MCLTWRCLTYKSNIRSLNGFYYYYWCMWSVFSVIITTRAIKMRIFWLLQHLSLTVFVDTFKIDSVDKPLKFIHHHVYIVCRLGWTIFFYISLWPQLIKVYKNLPKRPKFALWESKKFGQVSSQLDSEVFTRGQLCLLLVMFIFQQCRQCLI